MSITACSNERKFCTGMLDIWMILSYPNNETEACSVRYVIVQRPVQIIVIECYKLLLKLVYTGVVVAQCWYPGLQSNRLNDWSCTWGMIHIKMHPISPCCFHQSIALQCRMWPKTPFICFLLEAIYLKCNPIPLILHFMICLTHLDFISLTDPITQENT